MEEKILDILNEIKENVDFCSSTSFITDGLLTSVDIIMLVSELDDVFEITIPAAEVTPNNFCSLEAICCLVTRLMDE